MDQTSANVFIRIRSRAAEVFPGLFTASVRSSGPDISDFDCFMVNIVGEGITTAVEDQSRVAAQLLDGAAGSACTYFGATSPLLSVTTGEVSSQLTVPKGPSRLIQLFGFEFDGTAECPAGRNVRSRAEYDALDAKEGYELSRATLDIRSDVSVNLENLYDPAEPKLLSSCTDTGDIPSTDPQGPNPVSLTLGTGYRVLDPNTAPINAPVRTVLPASEITPTGLLDLIHPSGLLAFEFLSTVSSIDHPGIELHFVVPNSLDVNVYAQIEVDLDVDLGFIARSTTSGPCLTATPGSPVTGGQYTVSTAIGGTWIGARSGMTGGTTHVYYALTSAPLQQYLSIPAAGSVISERVFSVFIRNEGLSSASNCSTVAVRSARVRLIP